jgi:hypothetical protein
MSESQAKGDVFLKVFDQVVKKWGNRGLQTIEKDPGQYKMEHWYSFEELCITLRDIKIKLGNNSPLTIYQLGFRIIKDDPRWQNIFDDRDPAEIFMSTKRQDGQYKAGTQDVKQISEKHVQVDLLNWDCDDVWYDFFRGRLQGVLELTGRTGVVHLIPECKEDGIRTLDIKWG